MDQVSPFQLHYVFIIWTRDKHNYFHLLCIDDSVHFKPITLCYVLSIVNTHIMK